MVSIFSRKPGAAFSRPFILSTTALSAAVLLAGLAGCHQAVTDPKDPKFIVADTKTWSMTKAQLNDEIATVLKEQKQTPETIGPAKMPLLESNVLHMMVMKKLLLDRAAQLPLKDVDKDEAAALEQLKGHFPTEKDFTDRLQTAGITLDELKKQIHEEILIHKTLEIEAFKDAQPSDQEINAFYLSNKEKFNTPGKVRASRIVILMDDKTAPADKIAKKKAIDKAHARVAKGEDFGKVATEVSEDRYSAPKGGDIGYFQKGENEANFDDVAFSTKPGQVSPVFETPMGYQFLKVTDVHAGGVVSIAEAHDLITKYLTQTKQSQLEQAYTQKLLADSGVTFHLIGVDPTGTQGANTPGGAPTPAPAQPQDDAGAPAPSAPPAANDSTTPPPAPTPADNPPAK